MLNVSSPGPISLELKDEITLKKTRRAVKTCYDAGFNAVGLLWASPEVGWEIVKTAEGLGLKVLYQNLKRFGGMGHSRIFCEENDLDGAITDTANWKSIMGYCLWDEPIVEEHLHKVHEMVELVEKRRPDLLPYTVANPSDHRYCRFEDNAYIPYINRFLDVIDPAEMCFDHYPVGKPEYEPETQLDNTLMWCDLEVVRRAAQKRGIPFWFYYQAHRYHFHKKYYHFKHSMARSMAYAGVLHGAKALECYLEFDGFIDPATGGRGALFEEQKALNQELRTIGGTLMALTCLRVIHDDTLLPDCPYMEGLRTSMEESELLGGELFPRISVSEHEDDYGNKYLMVLNRDYDTPSHIRLTLKNNSNVYEVDKKDGEQKLLFHDSQYMIINLDPGDLRLYRIQDASEELYTVEYYLEKD